MKTFIISANFKPLIAGFIVIILCLAFRSEPVSVKNIPVKNPQPAPVIYTNLMVSQSSGLFLADGVAAGFGSQYSAAVDGDDAPKLWNFDES